MTRLTLLRHGDTGRAGYLDGRTDSALSDKGWRQMTAQTGGREWPLIVTSHLQRARLPAERLAASSGSRIIVDADWAELDFGAWDGQLRSAIDADTETREYLQRFYHAPHEPPPPQGENSTVFADRCERALRRVLSAPNGDGALIITHGGPIRAVLAVTLGFSLPSMWALSIGYGARLTLDVGVAEDGQLWGQLIDLLQAPDSAERTP